MGLPDPLPAVEALIPHRPPFLFVDRIVELTPKTIRTVRRFRPEEAFYAGHYPGNPITPGVLLCEACYQSGALLIAGNATGALQGVPVLTRSTNAKFRGMVKPGDEIEVAIELTEVLAGAHFMKGNVKVAGKTVLSVEFAVALVGQPG